MKRKPKTAMEKTKGTVDFILSISFLGVMLVISFFVIILPRWILKAVSKFNKR